MALSDSYITSEHFTERLSASAFNCTSEYSYSILVSLPRSRKDAEAREVLNRFYLAKLSVSAASRLSSRETKKPQLLDFSRDILCTVASN